MYCPKCGNKLKDDDKFCTSCGFQMEEEEQEEKSPIGLIILLIIALAAIVASGIFMFSHQRKPEGKTETVSSTDKKKQNTKKSGNGEKKSAENAPAVTNTPAPTDTPIPTDTPVLTEAPVQVDLPVDTPAPETPPPSESEAQQVTRSDRYQQAQNEIAALEAQSEEIKNTKLSGSQADINSCYEDLYNIWDAELNIIWGYLKETLDSTTMAQLKDVQITWIEDKEQAMAQIEESFNGGFAMKAAKYGEGYERTRTRTYELAEMLP